MSDTRNVVFGVACTLDGYIARTDHAVDWILWSDEAGELMRDYWSRFDSIVMGRKTYEAALGLGSGPEGDFGADMKSYVLSRTLAPDPKRDKGAEIVARDAVEFMTDLKRRPGKDICLMGGGELAAPLLEAGVVEELGLCIHPVLLGSGIPLFRRMGRDVALELREHKVFRDGCVYVNYGVRAG